MAEATLPSSSGPAWLDQPLTPAWQRIGVLSINWEMVAYSTIVLAGFLLRIWDVGSRALHHDESLHAYYAWQLFQGHGYSYDPLTHGPLQFELVPVFYLIFGVGELSARLLAVVLGTMLIFLPYFLRPYIGRSGALLTSVMICVSPGLVYFSRFIRDDIYLACFSLILFVAILRYLDTPKPYLLYIAGGAMALGMASMEAAYITFFIFGTFLAFEALREFVTERDGPVISAWKATSLDTLLTSISIFVVINVLLYSTFFTNPYGIWDTQHSLTSPFRTDILGGLTYWKAQHAVARGGQPWFYYLLVLPLYEQLAVVFGLAGIVYGFFRRSLTFTFMAWWAIMALGIYSWAGEKMPWLSIHVTLPFVLLGGAVLGRIWDSHRSWLIAPIGIVFGVLFALETHSTFLLNYVDGANPTEMLIYVQTSQDVPQVVNKISALSQRLTGGKNLQIGLDDNDVGGWPFTWYLRDYPNVTETASFNGPSCGGKYCAVLLMLSPEFDQYGGQLMKHYVAQKYRWNWWFPEDYKTWFPQQWGAALAGQGITNFFGTPTDWSHLWNWVVYRQPFGDRGARWMYVLVRRDLVPNEKQYSTAVPGTSTSGPAIAAPVLAARQILALGASGTVRLAGPRGLAYDSHGNMYVADTLNHRVVEYGRTGSALRTWGQAGSATGQFSSRDSPQGLAVGPDGHVFVADTWNQRIEVFTASGAFIRAWGGTNGSQPNQFYGPRSIAVSRTGKVYVADTGNKRIQIFTSTGRYLSSIGSGGTATGQFNEPSSVAVGANGSVYVSDFWNRRIQVFTSAGGYLTSWSVPDWTFGSYDEPYLAVDSRSGNVFATDPGQQRILEFTSNGTLIGSFGSGRVFLPIGLASLPGGKVGVSDPSSNQVVTFAVRKNAQIRLQSGQKSGFSKQTAVRPPKP